jgi:hypothetical protein
MRSADGRSQNLDQYISSLHKVSLNEKDHTPKLTRQMSKQLKVRDNMLAPAGPGAEVEPERIRAGEHEKAVGLGKHGELPEPTVKAADEESLNFNSILKGSAASRLTLFEKKAALINA